MRFMLEDDLKQGRRQTLPKPRKKQRPQLRSSGVFGKPLEFAAARRGCDGPRPSKLAVLPQGDMAQFARREKKQPIVSKTPAISLAGGIAHSDGFQRLILIEDTGRAKGLFRQNM
jgi:hypothetical protein